MGRMGNFDALNFSPLTNANAECVTKIEIENVLIFFILRNFASSDPSTATDGSYGERAHEDELGDVARRLYITIFLMRARRRTSADVSSLSEAEGKKGKAKGMAMGAPRARPT